jgi:hypothetical protein
MIIFKHQPQASRGGWGCGPTCCGRGTEGPSGRSPSKIWRFLAGKLINEFYGHGCGRDWSFFGLCMDHKHILKHSDDKQLSRPKTCSESDALLSPWGPGWSFCIVFSVKPEAPQLAALKFGISRARMLPLAERRNGFPKWFWTGESNSSNSKSIPKLRTSIQHPSS